MATTATAGVSRGIDPLQTAKFNVNLGPSLRDSTPHESRFSCVTFNHKPSQTSKTRSTVIRRSAEDDDIHTLSIHDDPQDQPTETKYIGRRREASTTYILTLDSDQQSFTLDELGPQYAFNLTSTTSEPNPKRLLQRYKQIEDSDHDNRQDSASSDGEADSNDASGDAPDPANPFDYRHYLHDLPAGGPSADSRNPSAAPTPLLHASARFPSPLQHPTKTPSSNTTTTNQNPTKPQQTNSRPRPKPRHPALTTAKPRANHATTTIPTKRAPAHSPSSSANGNGDNEDTNGLTIDMGDAPPRSKRRAPGAYLGTPLGGRPMSLREAVEGRSPGGFGGRRDGDREELAIDYAGEEDDDDDDDNHHNDEEDGDSGEGEEEDPDANNDVAPFSLPGPHIQPHSQPHPHPQPPARRHSTWDADAEAELQASLAEALEAQEAGLLLSEAAAGRRVVESDSESEEE